MLLKIKNSLALHKLKPNKDLIRPQTQQKEQEHTHSKFLTPPTPFIEKIMNLLGFRHII